MKRTLILVLAVIMLLGTIITIKTAFAAEGISVNRLIMCHGVANHEPTTPTDTFTPGTAVCFADFNVAQDQKVTFVWFLDGKEASRFAIEVKKSPRWRTWANRTVSTGAWKCAILDSAGNLLREVGFTVK
jgi:hypothetical protein